MHSRRPGDSRSGREAGEVGGWYLRQCRQEQRPAQTALGAGEWPTIFPHRHTGLSPAATYSGASSETGQPGNRWGLLESQSLARWAAGVGEVPLPTGREKGDYTRALGRTREPGNGNGVRAGHTSPPSSTSLPTAAPHHLRRHLFHRFLRLPHRRVVFRSGVLFLLFPSPPVQFPPLACNSLARSLSHLLQPRHPTE